VLLLVGCSHFLREVLARVPGCLQILYEAEEFETSLRSRSDLFNDACAIYQVVYEHAMPRNEVGKCGFAWKVAGHALCELYALKHGGERVTCLRSVLEDASLLLKSP
jgi:RNA-dependent RNA polymerase